MPGFSFAVPDSSATDISTSSAGTDRVRLAEATEERAREVADLVDSVVSAWEASRGQGGAALLYTYSVQWPRLHAVKGDHAYADDSTASAFFEFPLLDLLRDAIQRDTLAMDAFKVQLAAGRGTVALLHRHALPTYSLTSARVVKVEGADYASQYAKRIEELREAAEEEGYSMSERSVAAFLELLRAASHKVRYADVALAEGGDINAVWASEGNEDWLSVRVLGDGDVEYVHLSPDGYAASGTVSPQQFWSEFSERLSDLLVA